MSISRHTPLLLLVTVLFLVLQPVKAQLGYELEIKKPEPYESRLLKAERSGQKKFSKYKRFWQNTYTHYNYFFNANNKLNEVIDKAKEANVDDYTKLLPFYNYSLEVTTRDKIQLDSVIYKSKTAIVMHDLRNDWIDDMYLLWGAAYYLQKEFDSAYRMFQFINYSFAEKEKDGYYRYIGSRMDGNSALSIATKEDDGLIKKMVSDPPSRNTAFIWQIRTLMEAGAMIEAGSLIVTLKKDPVFPERLHPDLEEVQAYWFYRQNMWDSAATHLVNALPNAENKQEKARWEYLIAQLYERVNKPELAQEYYNKAIDHTVDPVMDINARLNLIRNNKSGGDQYIDENIEALLKMAKREKYVDYRDIIYYMAAQMELERKNLAAAQQFLLKAAKYNTFNNPQSRNRTYLLLGELTYNQKNYLAAASYYDSLEMSNILSPDSEKITKRKEGLAKVAINLNKINRQDSLQKIAAMPEAERNDYLKKLVRKLRKARGLREDEESFSTGSAGTNDNAYNPDSKGEWYFYNATLKNQGINVFKKAWGNRPNVDNWRRSSEVTNQLRTNVAGGDPRGNPTPGATDATNTAIEISYDNLLANVPLTPEQLKVSNEVIRTALVALSTAYLNDLEDYPSAIAAYEELRKRFPDYAGMSEALFNLYYAYSKAGDSAKASEIKNFLNKTYPDSRQTAILNTGVDPSAIKPTTEVTKVYETIYDQFLAGDFEAALAAKHNADSIYKTNHWSPQLLYIEAVYHIRQREDSIAKNTLNLIIQQNTNTALADKANNLIQVLSRRAQIEEELRNLNIVRPTEDTIKVTQYTPAPTALSRDNTVVQKNQVTINKEVGIKQRNDSTIAKTSIPLPALPSSYSFDPNTTHFVVIVLNKVDNVFGNEAKNAFNRYNKERYYNLPLNTQVVPLDADNKLMLIGNFSSVQQASEYATKIVPLSSKEIIPWLKADKYSFTIISERNLEILKQKTDLSSYRKFLEENSGLKF
jgi:tetratricopeptide (TPR) repeat protein